MTTCATVDPLLVRAWLSARSVARCSPQPIPDSGGWRVDTASPEEARRYVFAEPGDGLRRIGATIREPRVLLKLCGSEEVMQEALPPRWQIQSPSFMMVCASSAATDARLPPNYYAEVKKNNAVIAARILSTDGATAASGFAVQGHDVFIYDRIVTEPAHRRQGLATAIMAILASARQSDNSQQVLVATPEGRYLYESLGWKIYSPYVTAELPAKERPLSTHCGR